MTPEPIHAPDRGDGSRRSPITGITERIRVLEDELDAELEQSRADLRLRLEHGRVVFEEHVLQRHRGLKIGIWRYLREARLMVLLTAPFIYAVIVPTLLLDLIVSLYQATCFPVYGIAPVRRNEYLVFDRQQLAYLNIFEKVNCGYCAYANGVFAYVREVAARTEQYWCPIKHARRLVAPHRHYSDFVAYGDAEAYHGQLENLRKQLTEAGV